jgi:hypothetical protein
MISKNFLNALKNSGKPYHKIAWEAGITPNQLYKITAGIDRPGPDAPRMKALCDYLGLSIEDAFESDTTESHS